MELSARGHKTVAALLKKLEATSSGGKAGPATVMRRHRLAFTLLVLTRRGSGGAGSGGTGPSPETSEAIEDLIEFLEEQQERATAEPEDDEHGEEGSPGGSSGGSSNPQSSGPCMPAYRRYQDAVKKGNRIQANRLFKAYQACLRANANKPL